MSLISPRLVLAEVAAAIPPAARSRVVIIGSLAAAWHFFADNQSDSLRTKDVDCMFAPHSGAVVAASGVAQELIDAGWQIAPNTRLPGHAGTPDQDLPFVRLHPPPRSGSSEQPWFLELSGAPDARVRLPKTLHRLVLRRGHFALYSFRFLALTERFAEQTPFGVRVAHPSMMALANLLHHPCIAPDTIAGTEGHKRSNKDLGRVVALAWLELERTAAGGGDTLAAWSPLMAQALRECFPDEASALASSAGAGLQELLASPGDLAQAVFIANQGLLNSRNIHDQAFAATCARVIQRVIDPLQASL